MAAKGLLNHLRSVPAPEWWGYAIWGTAGTVIAVPEIWAAADSDSVPWTTISGMVGQLEYRWDWVALIVVAVIAFVAFNALRVPPGKRRALAGRPLVRLSQYGRLTARTAKAPRPGSTLGSTSTGSVPWWGVVLIVASFVVVGIAGWAVATYWDDPTHQRPGYFIYGLIALFWIVGPSVASYFFAREVHFPTLFGAVANLERRVDLLTGPSWLNAPSWLKPLTKSLIPYTILAGLTILVLHLTLYPFPSISKIIDPTDDGTLCAQTVKHQPAACKSR